MLLSLMRVTTIILKVPNMLICLTCVCSFVPLKRHGNLKPSLQRGENSIKGDLSHKSEVFQFPKLPSPHQIMPSSILFALSNNFVSVFVSVTQTRVEQDEESLVEGLPPLGCPLSKSVGIFLINGYVGVADYGGWCPPCEGGSGVWKTLGRHGSKPVSGIPPLPLLQFWP